MKYLKKILCVVLALAMVLGMSATAFADSSIDWDTAKKNVFKSRFWTSKVARNVLFNFEIFPLIGIKDLELWVKAPENFAGKKFTGNKIDCDGYTIKVADLFNPDSKYAEDRAIVSTIIYNWYNVFAAGKGLISEFIKEDEAVVISPDDIAEAMGKLYGFVQAGLANVNPQEFVEALLLASFVFRIISGPTPSCESAITALECSVEMICKNGIILPTTEAEDMVLFSKSLVGVYSPVLVAKPGDTIYVKANWLSLNMGVDRDDMPTKLRTAASNPFVKYQPKGVVTSAISNLFGLGGLDLVEVVPAIGGIPAVYKFVMPARMVTGFDFDGYGPVEYPYPTLSELLAKLIS